MVFVPLISSLDPEHRGPMLLSTRRGWDLRQLQGEALIQCNVQRD